MEDDGGDGESLLDSMLRPTSDTGEDLGEGTVRSRRVAIKANASVQGADRRHVQTDTFGSLEAASAPEPDRVQT